MEKTNAQTALEAAAQVTAGMLQKGYQISTVKSYTISLADDYLKWLNEQEPEEPTNDFL